LQPNSGPAIDLDPLCAPCWQTGRTQTPEQSLDTVRDAVREQYEQEQDAKRGQTIEPSEPTPEREPEEPDQDR